VKDLLDTFQSSRLMLALAEEDSFVLSRDPETISIKEILNCVRNSREQRRPERPASKEESIIDELLLDVEQSVADTLAGKNLQDLILSLSSAKPETVQGSVRW
jgi:DNA-binding IscR family transcriptional regulator